MSWLWSVVVRDGREIFAQKFNQLSDYVCAQSLILKLCITSKEGRRFEWGVDFLCLCWGERNETRFYFIGLRSDLQHYRLSAPNTLSKLHIGKNENEKFSLVSKKTEEDFMSAKKSCTALTQLTLNIKD